MEANFLEYLLPQLKAHFQTIETLLFIPFARPGGISYESYTNKVAEALKDFSFSVKGIHEFDDPKKAIETAQAIFVGGGNTFVLLDQLHRQDLISTFEKNFGKWNTLFGHQRR